MIIAKNIDDVERNTIIKQLKLKEEPAKRVWTMHRLKGIGINSFGVWNNPDRTEKYYQIHTVFANVYPEIYLKNGEPDIPAVLDELDMIMGNITVKDEQWRLQNIRFSKTIKTDKAETYIRLLNLGSSLSGINMSKTVNRKNKQEKINTRVPELVYENGSTKIHIFLEDGDLKISIELLKRKLKDYSLTHDVIKRDIISYNGKLKKMEAEIFKEYLEQLAGTGDYYSFKGAEQIIKNTSYSKPEKEKMYAVLNGIQVYKGIENFLRHVEDAKPKGDYMSKLKTKERAKTAIKNLEKLGINPVIISRRNAEAIFEEEDEQKLPNLLSLL